MVFPLMAKLRVGLLIICLSVFVLINGMSLPMSMAMILKQFVKPLMLHNAEPESPL